KKKINEGDTTRVNEVEIKAKEVIPAEAWRGGMATLEVGEEVEETVEDGDEYAEDSIWEYAITENSIGLVLTEEFTDLDEDYEVLASGSQICLPSEYVCVQYNGLAEEDYHSYDIEFDSVGGVEYVRINGDFQNDLEDYDRIYLNGTDFLDEDMEFITNSEIALADSDVFLTTNGTSLFFGDLSFPVSLNAVFDGATDISGRDEDYLTAFGITVKNPEDSVEDLSFTVEVPEERVEGSISIIKN
ncbi:MAG: hypothetical protein Q7K45_00335, partial [Nanoarchaeota archaeon]|nr:hypothetical protein [Nanoarchaeota archaeon]